MPEQRIESDSLGEIEVAADAWWGAQTERARRNFPVSGLRFPRRFIAALGTIKGECAAVNGELGIVAPELAAAIEAAAAEVADGELDAHFPLDVFQTGSGTSTNMNANEVIANRAIASLGGVVGSKRPVHPNDHVNAGPVLERRLPDRAARRRLRRGRRGARAGAAPAARCARRQGARVRRRRQDRPHPPAGRRADAARAGVRRLRAADRGRPRAARGREAAPRRAGARRHGGGHRPQRPARLRRRGDRPARGAHRAPVRAGAQPLRGAGREGRRGGDVRARSTSSPSRSPRSPTTCAGSPRARAAGSARSRSPRSSRAARSCPARSTR